MSLHFYPLSVKTVEKETPDCVKITLEVPAELREIFAYQAGQSLTLKHLHEGQELRRTYSLCSSPLENQWSIAVKKVPGGKFSAFANDLLKAGDRLEVMPPIGKFNSRLDPAQKKSYLAIAAGSGITPVISLIKTALQTEEKSQFTLIYGNRDRENIIFFEALQALKNRYTDRLQLIYLLSREKTDPELFHGRIDSLKLIALRSLVPYSAFNEVFLCGPAEMIFTCRDFLEQQGLKKNQLHFELFTEPGQSVSTSTLPRKVASTGASVSITLDGRTFSFDMPADSPKSLLDAALSEGADLPFACKGGMCCTCKAKLLKGEVTMDVHWGLEEEEVTNGYILTCQARPVSDEIAVNFDDR